MIETLWYVINSNTSPHTRALWARNVDATQTFFISDAKYSTLNEGLLRLTSYHISSDIILRNQCNQKVKDMVEAHLKVDTYTISIF